MSSILHILNGDTTFQSFSQTGLDGDIMVWREVLSEGPLRENISSGSFWNARSQWAIKAFNEPAELYQLKVMDELAKLNAPYDEINLWFDSDLHCQLNLIGAMRMLNQKTDMSAPAVYLICPESYPEVDNFISISQLNGDQLEDLYDAREHLNEWEFELAAEAWPLYVSGDGPGLEQWLNENSFWGALHLLKPALLAHVQRLQINADGLNYIEQKLLDIFNQGGQTKAAIYQAFWLTERIYGMGDQEIDLYLNSLKQKQLIEM